MLNPLVFDKRLRKRPRDSFRMSRPICRCVKHGTVPKLTKFYEMGTNDLLVFLEPLPGFQDETFREELRYFILESSIHRFASIYKT